MISKTRFEPDSSFSSIVFIERNLDFVNFINRIEKFEIGFVNEWKRKRNWFREKFQGSFEIQGNILLYLYHDPWTSINFASAWEKIPRTRSKAREIKFIPIVSNDPSTSVSHINFSKKFQGSYEACQRSLDPTSLPRESTILRHSRTCGSGYHGWMKIHGVCMKGWVWREWEYKSGVVWSECLRYFMAEERTNDRDVCENSWARAWWRKNKCDREDAQSRVG